MLFKVSEPSLDEVALKVIRYKVRQAIKYGRFRTQNQDDLVHDVWIHLQKKRKHFNPERASWPTFCSMIARQYLSREIKRRIRERSTRKSRMESLSEKKYDECGKAYYEEERVELQDSFESECKVIHSALHTVDLKVDLQSAIETMSVEHRELCETYLKSESLTTTAEQLGTSRKTIYRRRDQLKVELSESSLREYRY